MIKICSINVAGLRGSTITGKGPKTGHGLQKWFKKEKPDILCIQETKATLDESKKSLDLLGISCDNYYLTIDKYRKGHAGVGTYINPKVLNVIEVREPLEDLKDSKKYSYSGRYQEIVLEPINSKTVKQLIIINAYFHHADSPTVKLMDGTLIDREKSIKSMNQKHKFMNAIISRLRELKDANKEFVIVGDFNIAHRNIDIKNFKGNKTKAGFLPEERAWISLMLDGSSPMGVKENLDTKTNLKELKMLYKENTSFSYKPPKTSCFNVEPLGLIDIFREHNKNENIYSWWSNRGHAFDNDSGWRIDYIMSTLKLFKKATNSKIHKQESFLTRFSDHAPLVVDFDM